MKCHCQAEVIADYEVIVSLHFLVRPLHLSVNPLKQGRSLYLPCNLIRH